jgi:ketosteroid isomerase-like protein
MAEDHTDLIRRFVDGISEEAGTAYFALLDPSVELHVEDTLPDPQVHRGREGVAAFLGSLRDVWDELRFELDEVVEHRGGALMAMRQLGRGTGSGVFVEQQLFLDLAIRDDQIVRMDTFFDRGRARGAAGLDP